MGEFAYAYQKRSLVAAGLADSLNADPLLFVRWQGGVTDTARLGVRFDVDLSSDMGIEGQVALLLAVDFENISQDENGTRKE